MLTLNTKIERLSGVGPKLAKTLNKLGIFYIEDLLYHLPFRYLDFSQKTTTDKLETGQLVTIEGIVTEISSRRSFKSRLMFAEATLEDEQGSIKLMWFNQPYIAKQLSEGDKIIVSGKVEWYKDFQITNPYFEKVDSENTSGKILPVYHLTAGITNFRITKMVQLAWDITKESITDYLSGSIQKAFHLPSIKTSLENLHFPSNQDLIERARFRIAVDDSLPQQLAATLKQQALDKSSAPKIEVNIELVKKFLADLPFTITNSQKRASWDIFQDLESGKPMNRLLEGDVGSGKTLVAALASLTVMHNNLQTIILAPTEILARQHFETFVKFFPKQKSQVALLTSSYSETGSGILTKIELAKTISDNDCKIIIGTHALLSEKLYFPNLSLIIIDEQHRFGVAQRAFLQKQHVKDTVPHLLSMSATPIPRTLALSLFGNLQISQINTIPKSRKSIITYLLAETKRGIAYKKIQDEIKAGRQAFIITPKVEESETEVKSVKQEFERLQKLFPKLKIGLVHGGQKSNQKEAVMNEFYQRKLDILVATTVIEIGIDVPNATVILIEGAENFGLAQLHQLRGRVGRGEHQSFCYLFTTEESQLETERLQIFESINDGFKLAEFDLQQRGFGNLFGTDQSGFHFRFPKFITIQALQKSREIAEMILKQDPELTEHPLLKEKAYTYLESIHTE
jgi:ATP-dependent DNA helicase RecG